MKFSDLNKPRSEPAKAEPEKKARPVLPYKAEAPVPAPVPRPAPAEELPPEKAPRAEDREDAVKNGAAAYKPRQRETRNAPKEPAVPFRDLDVKAREVYTRIMKQTGELLRHIDQPYTERYESILRACALAADTLRTNSVLLNYTTFATAEDYLHAHTANTAILAIAMGLAADLDPAELSLLGFCAMTHDIGMTAYDGIYRSEDRLTDEQFSEITLHTEAGMEKLDRIVDIDYRIKDRAKRIILQTHERMDGSGYPDRLTHEEIDPLAQIIGIADVYEAMTHPRAWRAPMNPPDVVKELIEKEGRGFNSGVVKALISALSIYPAGSFVALSTGEIAKVIKVNKGSLTRPLVEIVLDPEFAPAAVHSLDLLEYPLTSIERTVDPKEIEERNPKFFAKLDLARWWVEW